VSIGEEEVRAPAKVATEELICFAVWVSRPVPAARMAQDHAGARMSPIVQALCATRRFAGRVYGRKEQGQQQSDDRNNDQQLDQREPSSPQEDIFRPHHVSLWFCFKSTGRLSEQLNLLRLRRSATPPPPHLPEVLDLAASLSGSTETLAISRQAVSHFLHASAHSFIWGSSCREHSAAQILQASAQAKHAVAIKGLSRAMSSVESRQNSWQSIVKVAVR
jgi:hypothetical protein